MCSRPSGASPVHSAGDGLSWNQGSTGLADVVAFRTLDVVGQSDANLARIVTGDSKFDLWDEVWFDLRGGARALWLKNGMQLSTRDFRPQNLTFGGAVCDYVKGK